MKLGNNEAIVLSLMKNYPNLDENGLELAFRSLTNKKVRIDSILQSFKIKGIINEKTKKLVLDHYDVNIPNVKLDERIVKNLPLFDDVIKIGKLGKSIMYLLNKTRKASLQFISTFFEKPPRNIYAILQRLEEKNFVLSYSPG